MQLYYLEFPMNECASQQFKKFLHRIILGRYNYVEWTQPENGNLLKMKSDLKYYEEPWKILNHRLTGTNSSHLALLHALTWESAWSILQIHLIMDGRVILYIFACFNVSEEWHATETDPVHRDFRLHVQSKPISIFSKHTHIICTT